MVIHVAVILSFWTIFSSPTTYRRANKWSCFILLTLNKDCLFYLKCPSPSPPSNPGFVLLCSNLSLRACFLLPFCLKDRAILQLLAPSATHANSYHNIQFTMLSLPVYLIVSSETKFPEQTSHFISHLIIYHCYCSFIDVWYISKVTNEWTHRWVNEWVKKILIWSYTMYTEMSSLPLSKLLRLCSCDYFIVLWISKGI